MGAQLAGWIYACVTCVNFVCVCACVCVCQCIVISWHPTLQLPCMHDRGGCHRLSNCYVCARRVGEQHCLLAANIVAAALGNQCLAMTAANLWLPQTVDWCVCM
jgi:hypothetical protein